MSDLAQQDLIIPLTSEAKIRANRENARKSTGPKTQQGKRNSSRNALKHGIFSSVVDADSEDGRLFSGLVGELWNEYAPVGVRESIAIQHAALCLLRLRKAFKYETQQTQSREQAGLRQQLGGTVHYETHLQRAYKEAFKELEQLQAERKAKEERDSSTPASSADVT